MLSCEKYISILYYMINYKDKYLKYKNKYIKNKLIGEDIVINDISIKEFIRSIFYYLKFFDICFTNGTFIFEDNEYKLFYILTFNTQSIDPIEKCNKINPTTKSYWSINHNYFQDGIVNILNIKPLLMKKKISPKKITDAIQLKDKTIKTAKDALSKQKSKHVTERYNKKHLQQIKQNFIIEIKYISKYINNNNIKLILHINFNNNDNIIELIEKLKEITERKIEEYESFNEINNILIYKIINISGNILKINNILKVKTGGYPNCIKTDYIPKLFKLQRELNLNNDSDIINHVCDQNSKTSEWLENNKIDKRVILYYPFTNVNTRNCNKNTESEETTQPEEPIQPKEPTQSKDPAQSGREQLEISDANKKKYCKDKYTEVKQKFLFFKLEGYDINHPIPMYKMLFKEKTTTYSIRREDDNTNNYKEKYMDLDMQFYNKHYDYYKEFLECSEYKQQYNKQIDIYEYIDKVEHFKEESKKNINNYNCKVRKGNELYITNDLLNFFLNYFNNNIIFNDYLIFVNKKVNHS